MPVEIERKFLLLDDSWRSGVTQARRLRQAYLTKNERISIRVRVDDEETASLTIKSAAAGMERNEYEYAIPVRDALELIEKREGSIISKRRHIVALDGQRWEIDVFDGENLGLIVAEIELPDVDKVFSHPTWLGKEITHDRRYYNADLARKPYRTWAGAGPDRAVAPPLPASA